MTDNFFIKLFKSSNSNSRYKIWRHCNNLFANNRGNVDDNVIDFLASQLKLYLISDEMYCGSTFLLNRDYKVFIPIVKIIQESKYNPLNNISVEELINDTNLNLIDDISYRIKIVYTNWQPPEEGQSNIATDTFIYKILFVTLGCVPIIDRHFIDWL